MKILQIAVDLHLMKALSRLPLLRRNWPCPWNRKQHLRPGSDLHQLFQAPVSDKDTTLQHSLAALLDLLCRRRYLTAIADKKKLRGRVGLCVYVAFLLSRTLDHPADLAGFPRKVLVIVPEAVFRTVLIAVVCLPLSCLNLYKPRSKLRHIRSVVQMLDRLQVVLPHKERLLRAPGLHNRSKDILILGLTEDQCRISADLRIRVLEKTDKDRKIASEQNHKLPLEALVPDHLTH